MLRPSLFLCASAVVFLVGELHAAPSPSAALQLTPIQSGVDYSKPDEATAKRSTIHSVKTRGTVGWVVKSPTGLILRRFMDTNRDNKVDLWCYYKNGVEVYRDIDANFNGKADQYRWLGTAGTRWGLDKNEDGTIDQWKVISAEEVTSEWVAALRTKDQERFQRILLSPAALRSLRLGKEQTSQIAARLTSAKRDFLTLARQQSVVKSSTKWLHFGATRPGILPAGTNGSQLDVSIYDNVAAIIESEGKTRQLPIGTLVRVGETWKLIGIPASLSNADQITGFFFQAQPSRQAVAGTQVQPPNAQFQKLLQQLDGLEKQLAKATLAGKPKLHERQARLIAQLSKHAPRPEDRKSWRRQFVDAITAATQSGSFPAGVKRLEDWYQSLKTQSGEKNEIAYAKFRWMTSRYTLALQQPMAKFAKIQKQWIANLKQFVEDYPLANDTAEAILQVAMAEEFAGKTDSAKKWYSRIVRDFPNKTVAKKAAGAQRRLGLVGKSMQLQGKDLNGRSVDLAESRGKLVAVHYWATWCKPCKQDIRELRRLQAKYGNRGLAFIGVNLDNKKATVVQYLRTNRIPWSQMFEEGGLESKYAIQLGILTLPTMILVGKDGKVVSRGIHIGQLETELENRLK